MNQIRYKATKFLRSEEGPTTVEYAVMLALILMAVIATVAAMGGTLSGMFDTTATLVAGAS